MKKNRQLLPLIIISILTSLILAAFVFLITARQVVPPKSSEISKIEISDPKTNTKIEFGNNGLVQFQGQTGSTSQAWDTSKTSAFFDYVLHNFHEGQTDGFVITINNNGVIKTGSISYIDELINTVISQIPGSTFPTATPNTNLQDFFTSPTPFSTTYIDPETQIICMHWRLSYCADYLYPSLSPTPTASGNPNVINANDCDDWSNQNSYRTVISNSSCVTTPSPTPEE